MSSGTREAGSRTRLIVWIAPLLAWMLMPESTSRGSWNAGFWSRRVRPRGLTMPPLAMVTDRAVSTLPVPSLRSVTNVVAQHVSLIWSMVGVLVIVVSAARSWAGGGQVGDEVLEREIVRHGFCGG